MHLKSGDGGARVALLGYWRLLERFSRNSELMSGERHGQGFVLLYQLLTRRFSADELTQLDGTTPTAQPELASLLNALCGRTSQVAPRRRPAAPSTPWHSAPRLVSPGPN